MIQPRRAFSWLFVGVLTGLFVLSSLSPRLWERAARDGVKPSNAKGDLSSLGLDARRAEICLPPAPCVPLTETDDVRSPISRSNADPLAEIETTEPRTNKELDGERLASFFEAGDSDAIRTMPEEEMPTASAEIRGEQVDTASSPVEPVAEASPPDEPIAAAPTESTEVKLVEPTAKIGAEAAEPREISVDVTAAEGVEDSPEAAASDPLRRLPEVMANVPSAVSRLLRDEIQPSGEALDSAAEASNALSKTPPPRPMRSDRNDEAIWHAPDVLIEDLNSLAAVAGPVGKWAKDAIQQIHALGSAIPERDPKTAGILAKLADLESQSHSLADQTPERRIAQTLDRTAYALRRRLDVWQGVVELGGATPADGNVVEVEPERLSLCLAEIASATGDSAEGRAWRDYLLLDTLKQSAEQKSTSVDEATRRLAQRALDRLTQTALTPHQQRFLASEPVAALRAELRRWAAEPIDVASVLRDIEAYERTGLPSDARRLAVDCRHLGASSVEERNALAQRIATHWCNRNVRVAVTADLLNKLIPEQNMEYAPVDDTVLALPVRGERLMATDLAVRMVPAPDRVRLALEVTGRISSSTTTDAGPARFHNESDSSYVARKPLEIDMKGISVWPVEVDVQNDTRLTDVETPLDGVPLLSSGARLLAKAQSEQSKPAATREVKQKIAAQARERINAETKQRLSEAVAKLNDRVFDPLNSLALDPQMIAAETTESRFVMQLRLAGEDQLGAHTPRPQAPSDSLASVQIHESVLNNGIQRLGLNGRTFSLSELSQHIARRLNWPSPWEVNPDNAEVKITFADKDAVVVRCQEGQILLTLSIARLSKDTYKWKNFQIQASFKPEVSGRSAQLVRNGLIRVTGQQRLGSRVILQGIFAHALSKNNPWNLVPDAIAQSPKLAYAAITQFAIDDGWIGVSLGPKPAAGTAARRSKIWK